MPQHLRFVSKPADDSFLHVAELLHRIRNDYARVISFASLAAARTSNQETKSALGAVISHLHTTAETLRVLRPPLTAHVTLREEQPVRFTIAGTTYIVTSVSGPWRSSGDWWSSQSWSREEWDVSAHHGSTAALYRLVHDRKDKTWLVDGSYD